MTEIISQSLGVSIVVVNYNNERFLAAAIDSALSQDHPLCEVIVVDDCSTDNSRAVIACYGDRIRPVLRETNGGQTAALNDAWPLARYPILMFLDSDDLLFPYAAATVAGTWTAATVKAQFLLATIDKIGRRLGHVAPKYPPNLDTATIRTELLRSGQCPSTSGSGNAYSRSLLDRISADGGFDLENLRQYWMDFILECNAPFYGEIVTIYEPLACYRVHDNNDSLQSTIDSARFAHASGLFALKLDYLAQRCRTWGIPFDPAAAGDHSLWLLECRLAAAKLAAAEHSPREAILMTLYHALRACIEAPLPLSHRIIRAAWFASVAATPRPLARRLIAHRFVVNQRPAWFERVLNKAKLSALHASSRS